MVQINPFNINQEGFWTLLTWRQLQTTEATAFYDARKSEATTSFYHIMNQITGAW